MSRRVRMIVFLAGAAGLAVMFGVAFARMPAFGAVVHLYRTRAVRAAVAHRTTNVVSSVNSDLRGMDTLGEETILIASVVGAAVLLRPAGEETQALAGSGRSPPTRPARPSGRPPSRRPTWPGWTSPGRSWPIPERAQHLGLGLRQRS